MYMWVQTYILIHRTSNIFVHLAIQVSVPISGAHTDLYNVTMCKPNFLQESLTPKTIQPLQHSIKYKSFWFHYL